MRAKVFLAVMVGGCLLFGLLFLARNQSSDSSHQNAGSQTLAQAATTANPVKARSTKAHGATSTTSKSVPQPAPNEEDTPAAQHQVYVENRVDELMDLAMTDDPGSLDIILSELNNRDPEIRKAALEAAVQFGSRDAIPKLMDAASQTDDAKEKAGILDAVEFLKLPSATEVIAQAGGVKSSATKNSSLKTPRPPASSQTARPR